MDEADLARIGRQCVELYHQDDAARSAKKKKWEAGEKMVRQEIEVKKDSISGLKVSSNVKYPLLTTAAIQFSSRAYPGLIQDQQVAKPKVYGEETPEKKEKGERATRFMNWQLFVGMPEWEEDSDRLLLAVPNYGCMFREYYYSQEKGRMCSEVHTPKQVVVPPGTRSINEATRVSKPFNLYPREVVERIRSGYYADVDYQFEDEDSEAPEEFIQQQTWLDLDEDGFKEPYLVIIHVRSRKIARIEPNFTKRGIIVNDKDEVLRIEPVKRFVKYTFIPDPTGDFYDIGFFDLLYPLNQTINDIVNQLVDAGTLDNASNSSGFISTDFLGKMKGDFQMEIGRFKGIDATAEEVNKGIVSMAGKFNGPSQTLFSLLSFLLDAGRDVANLKEVLEGQVENNMTATTTMALIEQGLKVFSAIYKRIHRSMAHELSLLRDWNFLTTAPRYGIVLDLPNGVSYEDFDSSEFDFEPVSDPNLVTDLQKAGKAQILMQFINDPRVDQTQLYKDLWEGMNLGDYEDYAPEMTPEMQQLQAQAQQAMQVIQQIQEAYQQLQQDKSIEMSKEQREAREQQFDEKMRLAEQRRKDLESRENTKLTAAQTLERVAEAESKEPGDNLDEYQEKITKFVYDPQAKRIRAG